MDWNSWIREKLMFGNNAHSKNPHMICTWKPRSKCLDCSIQGELQCRFNKNDLLSFLILFGPFALAAIGGTIRAGYGWWLLGWLFYALFFFFVWEARVLCRHCPFWAEGDRILHCHANYGVIKIWKYQPGPMSKLEKIQFLAGAFILIAFPFPFMLMGGEFLLGAIAFTVAISFFYNLIRNTCTRCVNFSCPLNKTPKPVIDAYLLRNPEIRAAWESAGYVLNDSLGQ